jgi:glycine betaine/choline ABC-type transport system substrate-binding protein
MDSHVPIPGGLIYNNNLYIPITNSLFIKGAPIYENPLNEVHKSIHMNDLKGLNTLVDIKKDIVVKFSCPDLIG